MTKGVACYQKKSGHNLHVVAKYSNNETNYETIIPQDYYDSGEDVGDDWSFLLLTQAAANWPKNNPEGRQKLTLTGSYWIPAPSATSSSINILQLKLRKSQNHSSSTAMQEWQGPT